MSQLFAPNDTITKDIALCNCSKAFKDKTILWDVNGENQSREGKVTDVSRDHSTGKILLHVVYDGECSEHASDTIKINTKIDANLVRLKPEPTTLAGWKPQILTT